MNSPRSWACLVLSGKDLDPDIVTQKLKLKPDYSHKAHKTDAGVEVSGFWQLNSTLAETESLENHLMDLLKRLASVRGELKSFLENTDSHFYTSVEHSTVVTDGVILSPRIMMLLGNLGIKLELHQWSEKKDFQIIQN
ncbi:MAG: DUF4279 domain-containing protein [Leptospiraceae bacterium]|nr:DUF4279 domain-containing protein [Leptospiraceae bacterium]